MCTREAYFTYLISPRQTPHITLQEVKLLLMRTDISDIDIGIYTGQLWIPLETSVGRMKIDYTYYTFQTFAFAGALLPAYCLSVASI